MRIQRVNWYCVAQERRDGGGNQRYVAGAALESDQGSRGGAVLHIRKPFAPEATRRAGEILTGMQIDGPEDAWDALHPAGAGLELLSLCDIALWDLWARSKQSSVCDLLGRERDRIPAYLSTAFNVGTPQEYVELGLQCQARGYHGYKIHPYITFTDVWGEQVGYPQRDIELYEAVARDVSGLALMTDNFCSYSLEEALRVGRIVQDLGYEWYESPMMETEDRIEDYLRLKEALEIPICTTETTPGCHLQRQAWLDRKACDIARIDPAYGGFTACVRFARACRQAGVKLEIHVGDAYSLPLMGACEESFLKYYETFHLGDREVHKPGRLSPEPLADSQGFVPVGNAPGMGVEIDWSWLESQGR